MGLVQAFPTASSLSEATRNAIYQAGDEAHNAIRVKLKSAARTGLFYLNYTFEPIVMQYRRKGIVDDLIKAGFKVTVDPDGDSPATILIEWEK